RPGDPRRRAHRRRRRCLSRGRPVGRAPGGRTAGARDPGAHEAELATAHPYRARAGEADRRRRQRRRGRDGRTPRPRLRPRHHGGRGAPHRGLRPPRPRHRLGGRVPPLAPGGPPEGEGARPARRRPPRRRGAPPGALQQGRGARGTRGGGARGLELALLAPDLLGMHLGDLGAEVVKIEQPPGGDYLRQIGARKLAGLNLMHLRWNRGKKSLTLDLKRAEGQRLLHRLVATADVFIDGLRQGAAARCAADYATLRAVNPRLVYCTLSGAGASGPYAALATHGVAYDAFPGLAPPVTHADGSPRIPSYTAVGMLAAPLYAALAVCAALVQARATGTGRLLEVAELDVSATWQAEHLDAASNGVASAIPDMIPAVRYQYYGTADQRVVLLQASERKFWRNFCAAVGRPDLFEAKPGEPAGDHARGDEALRAELAAIFRTRTRAEWVELFIAHDVPGGPVYTADELLQDPHFRARELLFAQDHPVAGHVRLFGTPVKVDGERFEATPAPAPVDHTAEVLGGTLGLFADAIERLRAAGVECIRWLEPTRLLHA